MTGLEIIEAVRGQGADVLIEGENLRLRNGKHLPLELMEQVKAAKSDMISILQMDEQAKEKGFKIGLTGIIYYAHTGRNSMVFVERTSDKWEARRETFKDGEPKCFSHKDITEGTFDYCLFKANSYVDFVTKKRG